MGNVDSHLDKPKLLERCQWGKRSLESDILYVFLSLGTQVYKYICVIVDHWFFWVTGQSNHRENDALLDSL